MALYGGIFAIPVFAQSILGFTSQQTGMLLLPGALASSFAMPIAAKVNQRVSDPRRVLVGGALVLAFALYLLTPLNPQTTASDFFWPLIVRSFGTIFMFLPLQLAALAPVPKKDVSAATGLFNLTRQLGGSVGVALLTTMLDKRTAFHAAVLTDKLAASDPNVLARYRMLAQAMMGRGLDAVSAKATALKLLSGIVKAQAACMSFGDTFWATLALILGGLPLVFLLGKPDKGAAPIDVGGH